VRKRFMFSLAVAGQGSPPAHRRYHPPWLARRTASERLPT
jgi:hypothetical protein